MSKLILISLLLTLITGSLSLKTEQIQQQQGTRVIFYIENKIQQPQDYVQISFEIKSQKASLEQAINQAKKIVGKVEDIVNKYCLLYAKNKKNCEGVVQTSQYKIDPIYQLVRKVPTFVAFSVLHETTAKIQNVKNIGKLADDILKSGVSKINSFEWKPLEEVDNQEVTVTEGFELVNNICAKLGQQLGRIVAVSEVTDYEDQEQQQKPKAEKGQQEGQQQKKQEEEKTVVYRFEIVCREKQAKPKK